MMRLVRRLHRGQEGITLSELLVSMSIASIIIVAVGGFFIATLRAGSTNSASDQNSRVASSVMNSVTRYVHAASLLPKADGSSAPAVVEATPSRLTFTAFINLDGNSTDKPVLVRYSLNAAQRIVLDQWDGTEANGFYSFPAPTQVPNRSIVIGGPVASPTSDGDTLFTYLGAGNKAIATPVSGIVPTASLGTIRAVRVNLELGSTTAGKPANTHVQNTLYLFNVAYGTSAGAAP
jgi:type II secretory pathway pseudopilin PulG